MSLDALYLSDKKPREAWPGLQEMYALDPYLEPHEIKRYQREQSILLAAQHLLKMSVKKSYELQPGGPQHSDLVALMSEDHVRAVYEQKLRQRSAALESV